MYSWRQLNTQGLSQNVLHMRTHIFHPAPPATNTPVLSAPFLCPALTPTPTLVAHPEPQFYLSSSCANDCYLEGRVNGTRSASSEAMGSLCTHIVTAVRVEFNALPSLCTTLICWVHILPIWEHHVMLLCNTFVADDWSVRYGPSRAAGSETTIEETVHRAGRLPMLSK